MERIKEYLDRCFREYVMTPELENLKEEVLANATDHYADLISRGESEAEAEETVMASLGNIEALLNEIGAEKKHAESERFDPFGSDVFQEFADSVSTMFTSLFQPGRESGERVEQYDDVVSLNIRGLSMDIHVKPSRDDLLHVQAEGNLEQIRFENEGGQLKIQESGTGRTLFQNGIDLYLELPVHVSNMDIQLVSGDLDASQLRLDSLRFQSTSGDLNIRNGSIGDLAIRTVSGDAYLRLLEVSRFYAESASGDIDIRCENGGSFIGTAKSGDIDAVFLARFESAGFKTVSGDVSVTVGKGIPVHTDLKSISGSVDCSLTSAEGGSDICIRTVSGDISAG